MAIAGVEVATVVAVVETTTKEVENRLLFGHRALHSLGEGDVKTDHSLFSIKCTSLKLSNLMTKMSFKKSCMKSFLVA